MLKFWLAVYCRCVLHVLAAKSASILLLEAILRVWSACAEWTQARWKWNIKVKTQQYYINYKGPKGLQHKTKTYETQKTHLRVHSVYFSYICQYPSSTFLYNLDTPFNSSLLLLSVLSILDGLASCREPPNDWIMWQKIEINLNILLAADYIRHLYTIVKKVVSPISLSLSKSKCIDTEISFSTSWGPKTIKKKKISFKRVMTMSGCLCVPPLKFQRQMRLIREPG